MIGDDLLMIRIGAEIITLVYTIIKGRSDYRDLCLVWAATLRL